jgi:hypothetical protein
MLRKKSDQPISHAYTNLYKCNALQMHAELIKCSRGRILVITAFVLSAKSALRPLPTPIAVQPQRSATAEHVYLLMD